MGAGRLGRWYSAVLAVVALLALGYMYNPATGSMTAATGRTPLPGQRGIQPAPSVSATGIPGSAGAAVVGAQAVPFTRTAAGVEASFTTTTVTLPKSGRPMTVLVSVSAGIVMVQVGTVGGYFVSGVATPQQPLALDISMLPEQTSVGVQTQASVASVIAGAVGFE